MSTSVDVRCESCGGKASRYRWVSDQMGEKPPEPFDLCSRCDTQPQLEVEQVRPR